MNRIQRATNGQQIAVATANGLVFFDGAAQQRQVMTRADGSIASHVTDMAPHGKGWVAATPAGLTFLDGGTRSVYGFHGLVNNHVYTVAVDGDTLLAGTLGGPLDPAGRAREIGLPSRQLRAENQLKQAVPFQRGMARQDLRRHPSPRSGRCLAHLRQHARQRRRQSELHGRNRARQFMRERWSTAYWFWTRNGRHGKPSAPVYRHPT